MSTFSIYTYQLDPIFNNLQLDLFTTKSEYIRLIMNGKNKIFADLLLNSDIIYRNKKYNKVAIINQDDLIVLRIANHKKFSVERKFQKEEEYKEPSVRVIIDNRDDVQRILIENDTKAFNDTTDLVNILKKSLNTSLSKKKLHVSINHEYHDQEFWRYVEGNKGKIQMVRFEFKYPNLGRSYQTVKEILGDSNKNLQSKKTSIEYAAESGDGLEINKENEYISDMVKDCSDSGNPITMKINGYKSFVRTGKTNKTIDIDEMTIGLEKIEDLKALIKNL